MNLNFSQKITLVFVGAFFTAGILSTMVFPFWNLIREDVFEEVVILNNDRGICYVNSKDNMPKIIEECYLNSGDKTTIRYGESLAWAICNSTIDDLIFYKIC